MCPNIRRTLLTSVLVVVGATAGTIGAFSAASQEKPPSTTVESLLETGVTVLGQPVIYPGAGAPQVSASILTMAPGATTGLHRHDVPLFGHILSGELTVSYQGAGDKVYRSGDSLMEAIGTPHDGRNSGQTPVRILVVFMGSAGAKNTVPLN